MRQSLEAQQQQIRQLQDELAKRDSQIGDARSAAAAADAKATEAEAKATAVANSTAEVKTTTTTLSSDVSDLKLSNEAVKGAVQDAQKKIVAAETPSTIHYKGISITPGGFLAAETVTRTRGMSADINTPFTGDPFGAGRFRPCDRVRVHGTAEPVELAGGRQTGDSENRRLLRSGLPECGHDFQQPPEQQLYLRTRQAYAQVTWDNGWQLTGGQMWTLATENRKGINNRQESNPLQIDPQYVVGYTWARQYGFRVVKNFHDKFALGFAVEGPQATIGGRGFSTVTTINSAAAPATIVTSGATTATTGNFFINAPGSAAVSTTLSMLTVTPLTKLRT